jgi:hypothetical protein
LGLTITGRRITQQSAGKLPPEKSKKLAKNDLPKNARRYLPIGKLANGTPLTPWRSGHFWKNGGRAVIQTTVLTQFRICVHYCYSKFKKQRFFSDFTFTIGFLKL